MLQWLGLLLKMFIHVKRELTSVYSFQMKLTIHPKNTFKLNSIINAKIQFQDKNDHPFQDILIINYNINKSNMKCLDHSSR